MATPFRSGRKGIVGGLEAPERDLLRKLFRDVILTLEPDPREDEDPLARLLGIGEETEEPEDPALARLLPRGTQDEEAAAEFRRFTERSIREAKVGRLRMAAMDCESPRLELDDEHAAALSAALNDVRLILAARLGIETEQDAARVAEYSDWQQARDVESYMALVYQFVSWLQESLVEAMLSRLDSGSH